MQVCVRAHCRRPVLAAWWQLCLECSAPLLLSDSRPGAVIADRRMRAGWDAVDWAERIAPRSWGSADERDRWVLRVRCLVMASVVTGRASGCEHTDAADAALPVVAIARVPE